MNRTRPGRARHEATDVRKSGIAGLRKFDSSAQQGGGAARSTLPDFGIAEEPEFRIVEVTESGSPEYKSRRILKGRRS